MIALLIAFGYFLTGIIVVGFFASTSFGKDCLEIYDMRCIDNDNALMLFGCVLVWPILIIIVIGLFIIKNVVKTIAFVVGFTESFRKEKDA